MQEGGRSTQPGPRYPSRWGGRSGPWGRAGALVLDRGSLGCSGFHWSSAGTLDATKENELHFIVVMLKKLGDGAQGY